MRASCERRTRERKNARRAPRSSPSFARDRCAARGEPRDLRQFRTRDRPGINGICHIPAGRGSFPSRIIGPGHPKQKKSLFSQRCRRAVCVNDASRALSGRGMATRAVSVRGGPPSPGPERASCRAPCCGSPRPLAGNPSFSPSETKEDCVCVCASPPRGLNLVTSVRVWTCASGRRAGDAASSLLWGLAGVRSRPNGLRIGRSPREVTPPSLLCV